MRKELVALRQRINGSLSSGPPPYCHGGRSLQAHWGGYVRSLREASNPGMPYATPLSNNEYRAFRNALADYSVCS